MSSFVPNSFQVPNAFVDEVLNKISDAACKIYLVICRKTRGWNKEMDSISLSQLEEITGKSRPTVIKAKNELIKVGLVVEMPSTVHGNTYKLGDETSVGWTVKFPSKENLLDQDDSTASKKVLPVLVKKFNYASKEFLPLLVKNFYTQSNTIKNNSTKKKNNKKNDSAPEQPKADKFDFKAALINNGVSEETASEFMQVRKAKRSVNTERAFTLLAAQVEKANLTLAQGIDYCLNRQKPWAAFEAQWYFNEKKQSTQAPVQQQPQRRRFGNQENQNHMRTVREQVA